MNRTVNLTKRVQTSRGLRYCPVVLAANGRVARRSGDRRCSGRTAPGRGILRGVVGRGEAHTIIGRHGCRLDTMNERIILVAVSPE